MKPLTVEQLDQEIDITRRDLRQLIDQRRVLARAQRSTAVTQISRTAAFIAAHGPKNATQVSMALGISRGAANVMLSLMAQRGELVRVERGVYTVSVLKVSSGEK